MPAFKDSLGREWLVKISGPVINDVRKELDLDLVSLGDPVFPKLSNLGLLVNCLWVVCRKQAHALGVNDIQFGEGLVGDCLEGAAEALVEAVLDFFPRSIRETLRALSRQDAATKNAAMEMMQTTLQNPTLANAMMEKQKAVMQKLLDSLTQQNGATVSQASSAAPQTTEP